ncbi:MAG TPA: hypothetical protein VGB91_16605 [Rhizomicrobium sp.]
MLNRDVHDGLVGRLYASALGEAPWSETLAQFSAAFGTSASLIQMHDAEKKIVGFVAYPFTTRFATDFYASEIYRDDPRFAYFLGVRPGSIYYDGILYDIDEMSRDPRVRACNDAVSANYSLGAVIDLPRGATVYLSLLSTEAEGHACEAAIESFRRLAPHMRQAISLAQLVDQQAATQTALLEALARRADGIVLIGCDGTPVFVNEAARAVLTAGDGLVFSCGQFATLRGPETRRLQRLVCGAIARGAASETSPGGDMLVTRPSGRRPYVLRVMRAPATERFLSSGGFAAAIHIYDLAATPAPPPALLVAAFGFSGRETDLALGLARCANLAGAAAQAGMAVNTARNHLQGIFRKTGTASQAEAVQLLSRLA